MIAFLTLEWKCDVCKKVREDQFISVFKKDISAERNLRSGIMFHNIKYCNDDLNCRDKAPYIGKNFPESI